MPYADIDDGIRLYYELTGPEDAPVVLQFGGGLFGRHNFGLVNDAFRESFRLLSFDARGYGASSQPREGYTIESWAADGVRLLDALSLDTRPRPRHVDGRHDRDRIHGFARRADDRGLCRRRVRQAGRLPSHPLPRLAADGRNHAVGRLLRSRHDAGRRREVPRVRMRGRTRSSSYASVIALNDPYTVRQACIAMEEMDLSPLVPQIERPLLMTNGTHDILCPPELAPSGLGARGMAAAELQHPRPRVSGHRARRPARMPGRRRPDRERVLPRAPLGARLAGPVPRSAPRYFSGFVPAIQMMTRLNLPASSKSKKLQLCMSFLEPSFSSPI